MLNRQRREKPLVDKAIKGGERVVKPKFGVDEDICTGDHACMRLSGCPSLSVKSLDDPLRDDPVAHIDQSCVGCGNCGEVADAAVLCPSFYRADVVHNPGRWDRFLETVRSARDRLPAAPARKPQADFRRCLIPSRHQAAMESAGDGGIIKLAILAVGGQGGGVLADWIVDVAERNGYLAQSTSVAGVAQRTGATIYYIEMCRDAGRLPVFALSPSQGDVDILIAAELMEAGRAIMRGFVTPERTTLIASSHRIAAVSEKIEPGDGRASSAKVRETAELASKRFIAFDMEKIAVENGSMISASLLGALAGSGALPFPRESYEQTILASGRGVKASLAAFAGGFEGARGGVPAGLPLDRCSTGDEPGEGVLLPVLTGRRWWQS